MKTLHTHPPFVAPDHVPLRLPGDRHATFSPWQTLAAILCLILCLLLLSGCISAHREVPTSNSAAPSSSSTTITTYR